LGLFGVPLLRPPRHSPGFDPRDICYLTTKFLTGCGFSSISLLLGLPVLLLLRPPRRHLHGGAGVVENLQGDDGDVVLPVLVGRHYRDGAERRQLEGREVLSGRAGQPGPPLEPGPDTRSPACAR
jgi:hypothetical protein